MSPRRTGTRLASGGYRMAIYIRDRCRCMYCGKRVVPGAPLTQGNAATLDHVVPHNRGGDNGYRNLVTACVGCNSARGDKTTRQWYRVLRLAGVNTNTVSRRVISAGQKNIASYLRTARTITTNDRS